MKRYRWILMLLVGLSWVGCAAPEPLPEGVDGQWQARRPGGDSDIRLDLYLGPRGHRETERIRAWFEPDELTGLSAAVFAGSGEALEFSWERPAGVLHFSGTRARRPQGLFRFEPAPEFLARLEALGIATPDRPAILDLAIHGTPTELLDVLATNGYRGARVADLVRLRDYGLSADWIRSMARLAGPPNLDELIQLARNGVDRSDVDALIREGLGDLDADSIVSMQRSGLSASRAARYRALGFAQSDDWVVLSRYGVSEKLIEAIRRSPAPQTGLDEILSLHTHGVSAHDVDLAAPLIESGLDWEQFLYLAQRGVSVDYARALIESGWSGLVPEQIVQLSRNGVDAGWALKIRACAEPAAEVDVLIQLRQYGLAAEDYETYADLGYREDRARELVQLGVDADFMARTADLLPANLEPQEWARLHGAGVDRDFLEALTRAGIAGLEVEEIVAANRSGLERWLERSSQSK